MKDVKKCVGLFILFLPDALRVKKTCARRKTSLGLLPGKILQGGVWFFWPLPEARGVQSGATGRYNLGNEAS